MYLWLELFLLSSGITARLIIPAATAGSGVNLLVVLFIWLALLVHSVRKFTNRNQNAKLPNETITGLSNGVHLLDKTPAPGLPPVLKLLLFLFAGLIVASFINAPYMFGAFQYLVPWISDLVLFYLVYSLCVQDQRNMTLLLSVFLANAVIVTLYALYQHFWELPGLAEQIRQNPSLLDMMPDYLRSPAMARAIAGEPYATFLYQNSLGAFLALVIPLFIALAWMRQKRWPSFAIPDLQSGGWWMWLIVLLISLFVLIQTGSKGAILALVFGLGIAGAMLIPSIKRGGGVLILIGVVAALVLLVVISRSQMFDSFNVRLGYWEATVKIIKDNPVSGVGLNQFGNSYLYYKSAEAGEVQKAHNDYLQIASEMGIPAMLVFLVIWFLILKSIFRPAREPNTTQPPPQR
ncbi:MAG: O-antigen ligase family protein, partial [Planctomycetota bacterium]